VGRFISEQTREYLRLLAGVSSLGISIVLATVIGAGLGYLVDEHWGTGHWGAGIGLFVGIAAGFNNIYIYIKRFKDK
jgi:F0F1-type ATP synthase assembly protein I